MNVPVTRSKAKRMNLRRRHASLLTLFLSLYCLLHLSACTSGNQSNPGGADTANRAQPAATVSGNCANSFYPVSTTIRRNYTVTYAGSAKKPVTYTESFTDITPETFKLMTTLDGGSTITHAWKCSGGGLAALEYAQLNVGNQSAGGMKMDVDTVNAQGVMIPAESNWKVGYKWKTVFDISGKVEGAGGVSSGDMKSTVTLDHEIIGEESVTVPAGTFSTFKVHTKLSQTGTMTMSGSRGPATMNIPLDTTLDLTLYHARDTGLVKSVIDKIATTELTSLTK